jgi:hypothetical protein
MCFDAQQQRGEECRPPYSKVLSPIFWKTAMSKLEPFEQKIWHTNMVTFLPTFAVTYFAAPAILSYAVGGCTS